MARTGTHHMEPLSLLGRFARDEQRVVGVPTVIAVRGPLSLIDRVGVVLAVGIKRTGRWLER